MNLKTTRALRAMILLVVAALCSPKAAHAQAQKVESGMDISRYVGIDQRLDSQVAADTVFKDETGKTLKFGDYLGKKPLILVMPFYKCGGSCTLEMNEMVKVFLSKEFGFTPGKEFTAVSVSIDARETPEIAAAKKTSYMEDLALPGTDTGWHFLTGKQDAIDRLAQSVGFRYAYDPKTGNPVHMAGIIMITPKGKVSRYFPNTVYPPREVRLALVEASENRIGSLADKFYLYCTQYDPATGKRGVVIMQLVKISFLFTVLILALFIAINLRRDKFRTARQLDGTIEPAAEQGLNAGV